MILNRNELNIFKLRENTISLIKTKKMIIQKIILDQEI